MFASAEYGLRTMSMAGQLKKPHMTCSNLRPGASLNQDNANQLVAEDPYAHLAALVLVKGQYSTQSHERASI